MVRWKNFLSTGNAFTQIDLVRSPNTLIVGENGAGKSTILDALCFGLYGKPFRKIKKDQLINSINEKDCLVEVEFEAYNHRYLIRRGIKPNVFEIYKDGALLNQTAAIKDYQEYLEKTVMKMNMKSFLQIVILGSSSYVPFMMLPSNIRREIVEDLLDIRVFSLMNNILKDKSNDNRTEFTITERELENIEQLINATRTAMERSSKNKEQTIQTLKRRLNELFVTIKDRTVKISELENGIRDHDEIIQKLEKLRDKASDHKVTRSKLMDKLKSLKKSMDFYNENDHCPTCTQPIEDALKQTKIDSLNVKTEQLNDGFVKLDDLEKDNNNVLQEVLSKLKEYDAIKKEIEQEKRLNAGDMREYKSVKSNIEQLMQPEDEETGKELSSLEEKCEKLKEDKTRLALDKELYSIAGVILRDSGIKSRILKQYIPVINQLVNKYLSAMNFFVKFELNEDFEEKILSRHRDDFSYASFSEGEKTRINLALLFTWRAIARMKNSANTNLLILDEVFDSSLDPTGCEEFLNMIHGLENTNVFVISHKGDALQDKFRSSITFKKENNFSRIAT